MNGERRFWYNLPWPLIIICTALYGGSSIFLYRLADDYVGGIRLFLLLVSGALGALGILMLTRRVMFPRFLALGENEVIFPHGFPRTCFTRIQYGQIIRVLETSDSPRAGLYLGTSLGEFEIVDSYFRSIEQYRVVRDFICSKLDVKTDQKERWAPNPLLEWVEPEDWPQFRTLQARRVPLHLRVGKVCWFFARCLGLFVGPWLLLRVLEVPTAPTASHLGLSVIVSVFLTILYYLFQILPVHSTEISVRPNGITQNFGKQIVDRSFEMISGWRIMNQEIAGRSLLILLLQEKKRVSGIALPGEKAGEEISQILVEKGVPECAEVVPPWVMAR